MKKLILLILIFFSLNACYRLPQREEIEYRNTLENAIVDTFPKKVIVVIHPFSNLSKADTNRAYLETAIPDNIEAMLESLRSTLAYIPFDGMPFYVSSELSNLFQKVDLEDGEEGNFDEFGSNTNDDDEDDEDDDDEDDEDDEDDSIFDDADDDDEENDAVDRFEDSYFTYLTNYLLVVPTQETQYKPETTTNTNYFDFTTNEDFINGIIETSITSNEILRTTTNAIKTNLVIVNKNLLTPTNMLLMLYEEFPTLTNYLSFLPIEVRRATESDITAFADYKLKLSNPARWKAEQNKKAALAKQEQEKIEKEALAKSIEEAKERGEEIPKTPAPVVKSIDLVIETKEIEPSIPFEYVYHIGGDFRTRGTGSAIQPVETSVRLQIYPAYSSGDVWWEKNLSISPPLLSDILELEQSLDPKDKGSFKTVFLRTPFEKPDVSPRLQDEFDTFSTNFRDKKPPNPTNTLKKRTRPLNLRINVPENQIPIAMNDWLKYFHSVIINRPYTALRVTSNPTDSLVYLNGFFIGSTPLIYPTAPLGEQRILFLKEGFNREEILTDIIPNQTNSIVYTLQALNNAGTLSVMASIPDAEVYLNAQYKGKTPLVISNLTLYSKYRVEVIDPSSALSSNRNSVYKNITLTDEKTSINIDAQFKTYETSYRTPAQKGLLAATYISWFTTIGLLGASFYTQARSREAEDLIIAMGTITSGDKDQQEQLSTYQNDRDRFAIASQATLYSAIGATFLSTGIMSWYLYSKEIYLGLEVDPEKKEWYANFKLKF